MIELRTPTQIEQMRPAGRFVADVITRLSEVADVGMNLLELDAVAHEMIRERGAESCYIDYHPSFGASPFGKVLCTSVNDAVLHGLPRDYVLADGDLLSVDFAASVDGWVADSAFSMVVGTARAEDLHLIEVTDRALAAGIGAATPDESDTAGMGGMDHGATGMDGMGGMDMGEETMLSPLLGGAGDVSYPHFLVGGRVPDDPMTFTAAPGQRVRIRFVNAGADTAFRVALGGHRMTVTHTDGFPVVPQDTDSLLIGMGERFDVLVTLGDGVFPLFAQAEGKTGHGLALVRTAAGELPAQSRPGELERRVLLGTDLAPREYVRLTERDHDLYHSVDMGGTMSPYRWTLNGRAHPDIPPLNVNEGQRVRMRMRNMSDMFHPMHLHGHTFALTDTGLRKDTVTIGPMRTVEIEFDTDNPGQWALHCHNAYHQEAGMMTTVSYLA